jgi:asparagine synthase (glutamine-hydrolysing)
MSAIFGIVHKNGKAVDPTQTELLEGTLQHRCTDGKSLFLDGNVAFGHCRLYTHPQQRFENQPSSMGSLLVTADIRLDNRRELAKSLGLEQARLIETSDDQLLMMAYQKWQKDCVKQLEGEFAFALWDSVRQELFAATDPIGFRPLFYYDAPDRFIFCSEIKGVVAVKPLPNRFEEESLIEYSYRKGDPRKTYNKEVFALCGGNTITIPLNGRTRIEKYWTLTSTGKYHFRRDEDWYDCTRDLLYKAVEKRLNPEVPNGITLSGGLDSSSIACILSDLLLKKNKPLYAFSSVLPLNYNGIEKDERPYIEIVGKRCPNLIQTYVEAPGVGPLTDIEAAFDIEESFPNSFFYMDRALVHAAMEKRIRNIYNGFGGDYWVSNKGNSVIYCLMNDGHPMEALRLIQEFSRQQHTSFFHEFRCRYASRTPIYKALRSVLKRDKGINWQYKTFLRDDFLKAYARVLNETEKAEYASQKMKRWLEAGRIGRITALYNNRNGHFSMDSSIPLFDKDLMEFLYDVPAALYVRNGQPRNLFRMAIQPIVPEETFRRTDKLPYVPGFPHRVLGERNTYERIIADTSKDFLCTNSLATHFDAITPFEGFGSSNKIIDQQITHAGVIYFVIKELQRRQYQFSNP